MSKDDQSAPTPMAVERRHVLMPASAKHKWVSRANARDAWIAHVSDEQIVANIKACHLALTTRAHGFLTANDAADFLRASRALALHFPPIQRVAAGRFRPLARRRGNATRMRACIPG